jgi:hypothetical protein
MLPVLDRVTVTDERAAPWRQVRVARVIVAVLIVAAITYAVVSEWGDVSSALQTLNWANVVMAFLAVLMGMLAAGLAWRALLAGEGYPLPPWTAARIFLVGQLGKYLPGSV